MQSIGERLEEARKRKGISIREAAESTKIRSDYLHKFESNQYDLRLPEIYVRGFLRSYASFLKLPSDKIIADYNALTHVDPKASPRSVSREVYGRMDISTTKEQKAHGNESGVPGGSTPPMDVGDGPAAATQPATAPRNPATFVPPASGSPIDKKLLIKVGAIALVTLVIIVGIIVGVSQCSSSSSTPSPRGTAGAGNAGAGANTEIWVRPQPGERTFDIVAKNGPVTVKVASDTTIFFQGTIQQGDRRTLPRRVETRLEATPYGNVELIFDGTPYQIAGPTMVKAAQ